MKIKIDRELLQEKLSKIIKFVPTKTITPCFDNLKLTIKGSRMEIMASDGAVQCNLSCPVQSDGDFVVCIPGKLLLSTVSYFRENEVVITVKDKTAELKNGKSKYKIGLDTFENDYPVMRAQPTDEMVLNQFMLKKALTAADKFVNDKNVLPQMIGIRMMDIGNRIIFTGADTSIMCRVQVKPVSINQWSEVVLPTDTASKVVSLLEDKGEITVLSSGDKIIFSTGEDTPENFQIISVLNNLKFPDSEALFDKKTEEHIIVNVLEFKDALRRLNLYTLDGTTPLVIIKTGEDMSEISLTAGSDLANRSGEEIITVSNVTGKMVHKAFNIDQLLKILTSIDENDFQFNYNENHKMPAFISPVIPTDAENMFHFLVSSMQL